MRHLIVSAAMAVATFSAEAAESLKVSVNGLVCASCAEAIEESISKMDATKAVFVDLRRKIVAIEAKDGRKPDLQAIQAVLVEAGYHVVKIESVPQSVAQIRAQAKGRK